MRTHVILLTLALVLPLAAGGAGAQTDTVTVTLTVDGENITPFDVVYGETATSATCTVTVPAGANAGDILDKAVADGCLSSWTFTSDPAFGRFVAAINGLEGHCDAWPALCSFWEFNVNGAASDVGIDLYGAADGDAILFDYDKTTLEDV